MSDSNTHSSSSIHPFLFLTISISQFSVIFPSLADFPSQLLSAVVLLGYKLVRGVGVVWYHTPVRTCKCVNTRTHTKDTETHILASVVTTNL